MRFSVQESALAFISNNKRIHVTRHCLQFLGSTLLWQTLTTEWRKCHATYSNVDGDVPSLSSLILHLDESAFNLRDEQTRETRRCVGTESWNSRKWYLFCTAISCVQDTRGARLMQSVTLPATCKRDTRTFKSPRVRKEDPLKNARQPCIYPATARTLGRALSLRRHAWYASNYRRSAIARMNERAAIFLSCALLTRESLARCSPDIKRRVIATRACGTEEPARRVRAPLASLISMLRFLSHEWPSVPAAKSNCAFKDLE